MTEAKTSLRDVEEHLAAAIETLNQTSTRAPANGVVITTVYNIILNAIGPGKKIMEILPTVSRPLWQCQIDAGDRRCHTAGTGLFLTT
ncbi:hypothetical protein ELH51_33615 (plasmid) [Rhizobium ruizarguesonis]|uniref:hypothetical protein n=1 Tax=Rhizobium TaxID=379 RepID=UPI00103059C2|nr:MULTISPECIES: hypothetical protein [Rhizobium]MBY2950949.1 hypothetical protein [Rhizobium leguminosarum]TBB15099.1 hypothetical protein ELH51_33615 [Rhizobium ruizarguesonis]